MDLNCTTDNYETLYAPWLESPGALLTWGDYDPTKHNLLDLCGGTGVVALAALERGAPACSQTLLDLNPRCTDSRVSARALKGRAEDLALLAPDRTWDFVVCRQALGYLDLPAVNRALYCSMERGGVFVCNAFVRPKWSASAYRYKNRHYFEVSGYFGRTVFHLQAMRNDFDVSAFRWHSTHDIVKAFSPCFTLEGFDTTPASMRFLFKRR